MAVTGRLSSDNPNLQNKYPIHYGRGRQIRKAFIPRNEEKTYADYSQIELHIVASISGDQTWQKPLI